MEPFIDIILEDPRWDDLGLESLAEAAIDAALGEVGLAKQGLMFCLMACDDAQIAQLNGQFRGKDSPTNVLSWPSQERGALIAGHRPAPPVAGDDDDPESLGDIAIAFDTCAGEAAAAGRSVEWHVQHLVIHGFLHLLGYDHIRDEDAALMEEIERRALAKLGISDPYL